MTSRFTTGVAAAAIAALTLTGATAVTTFVTADAAYAKGNGNGNGNGNRGGNRGGREDRGGRDDRGGPGDRGRGASEERGNSGNAGRGGGHGGNGAQTRQAAPQDARSAPQRGNSAQAPGQLRKAQSAPSSSLAPTARPMTAAAEITPEGEEMPGAHSGNWKSRLDDGVLDTPANVLGFWNSARRSEQAIANMVEKYRETGDASGAGGKIGQLIVAYGGYNEALGGATGEGGLQEAVDSGLISAADANALLDGSLAFEDVLAALGADVTSIEDAAAALSDETLGRTVSVVDGVIVCEGVDCEAIAGDIESLQMQLDDATALTGSIEDLAEAQALLEAAQGTLPDDPMAVDEIEQLLQISLDEAPEITEPEPEPEPGTETSTETETGEGGGESAL